MNLKPRIHLVAAAISLAGLLGPGSLAMGQPATSTRVPNQSGAGRSFEAVTSSRSSGTRSVLSSVAFANGQFVAAGDAGTILTSRDGSIWRRQQSAGDGYHYAVASGDGRWIVAGDGILMSQDGVAWASAESRVTPRIENLTFGNGRFVGVGGRSVFTSGDGRKWTKQQISGRCWLQSVACGGGLFVAVGWQGGDCAILTSLDGAIWTRQEPAMRTLATATSLNLAQVRGAGTK